MAARTQVRKKRPPRKKSLPPVQTTPEASKEKKATPKQIEPTPSNFGAMTTFMDAIQNVVPPFFPVPPTTMLGGQGGLYFQFKSPPLQPTPLIMLNTTPPKPVNPPPILLTPPKAASPSTKTVSPIVSPKSPKNATNSILKSCRIIVHGDDFELSQSELIDEIKKYGGTVLDGFQAQDINTLTHVITTINNLETIPKGLNAFIVNEKWM